MRDKTSSYGRTGDHLGRRRRVRSQRDHARGQTLGRYRQVGLPPHCRPALDEEFPHGRPQPVRRRRRPGRGSARVPLRRPERCRRRPRGDHRRIVRCADDLRRARRSDRPLRRRPRRAGPRPGRRDRPVRAQQRLLPGRLPRRARRGRRGDDRELALHARRARLPAARLRREDARHDHPVPRPGPRRDGPGRRRRHRDRPHRRHPRRRRHPAARERARRPAVDHGRAPAGDGDRRRRRRAALLVRAPPGAPRASC